MASRLPDYKVKALDKVTDEKGYIGGAWENSDGSISIKLNPWITLESSPDLVITLFPCDNHQRVPQRNMPRRAIEDNEHDDIPF